jgi:hypothetical protein
MKCNCFECPLGKSDYENYIEIYKCLKEEPDPNEIAWSTWCEKIGGKCGWYGFCDEAFEEDIKHKYNNKKPKKNKWQRQDKHLRRLIYLNVIANYPPPVMYIDEKWDNKLRCYISVDRPYYKRLYRNNHKGGRHKFYKKYANRVVRNYAFGIYDEFDDNLITYDRTHGQLKNGGSYKKVFDYWWTVD